MTKEVLHQQLADGFGVDKKQIHSEYGMTELLSRRRIVVEVYGLMPFLGCEFHP